MPSLSIPALRTGGPSYLPRSRILNAGPLTLLLEQGELRRIRLGGREVLRRIYLTVRGPDWGTIPAAVSGEKLVAGPDSFELEYILAHKLGGFDFAWEVKVKGTPDGVVDFQARGRAGSAFETNRVGVCALLPLRECAAEPALVTGMDGDTRESPFPGMVDPHQPFLAFKEIAYKVSEGWLARVRLEGETFEMEDQRNWTDGSFKIYCPPQDRPKPRRIEAGWETLQSVTLELHNPRETPPPAPEPALPVLRVDTKRGAAIPSIGFGVASHGQTMHAGDAGRLSALQPSHLRADFRLAQPGYREDLRRAAAEAQALSLPLEVALVVPENGEDALAAFAADWEESGAEALRWLVFSELKDAATEEAMDSARRHLGPLDPLAAFARGSKGDFVLLNRNRPRPVPGISLAWGMSPQVHLTDNRTLVESLEGQAWTVRTAADEWPKAKISATPVTLKRAPFAVSLKKPPLPGPGSPLAEAWRNQVDTRQFSLFGAGWTLGSLKRLASEGASTATFFETSGLLGVLAGSGLSGDFRQSPAFDFTLEAGWVYPMYHVFADFAEFVGGQAFDMPSDAPLRFDGVLLHVEGKACILAANLEETPGRVRFEGLGKVVGMRRLNEKNAMFAMENPEGYRAAPLEPCSGTDEGWEIEMLPFEIVRLDLGA